MFMEKKEIRHLDFVMYCIETYKGMKNMEGASVYHQFEETGAIEYIDDNYDALHTFSDENIVWNIDNYLNNYNY